MAAGFRGLLAPWLGGGGADVTQAGVRSLLAFWMGGGAIRVSESPPIDSGGGGSASMHAPRRIHRVPRRAIEEDEALLLAVLR